MPKIVDHGRQREVLLDACFRVFADEGYAAATMRKLASAAGVSTGMLYHYFPDKEAILAELVELLLRRDRLRMRNDLREDAPVPVRIRALFEFARRNEDYLRDVLRVAFEVLRYEPDHRARRHVAEGMRAYRSDVRDLLGVDELLAGMTFSFVLGSLVQGLLDAEGVDLVAQEAFAQGVWRRFAAEAGITDPSLLESP